MSARKPFVVERISFSIQEVADSHGLQARTIRRMVERGELRVMRFGASIRIPKREIERLERRGPGLDAAGARRERGGVGVARPSAIERARAAPKRS